MLAAVLKDKNNTLRCLDLSDNELGVAGVAAFEGAREGCTLTLRGNTSVEEISVLMSGPVDERGLS